MHMTLPYYISKSKELAVDFWFHTGYEQRSPEQKSCPRLIHRSSVPPPDMVLLLFRLLHLTTT